MFRKRSLADDQRCLSRLEVVEEVFCTIYWNCELKSDKEQIVSEMFDFQPSGNRQ